MKQGDGRRGMILVTVLWTISLLSALAMAASVTFRGYAGVMALERDRIQAEALLAAGVEAAAGVMDTTRDFPLAEFESTIPIRSGAVHVRLQYEGGRIDITKAPLELLASLLVSVGAPQALALDIGRRIVERRRLSVATDQNNQAQSSNVSNNASEASQPIIEIRQLQSVPGMTPGWIAAISPLVTVFGDQTIDPMTAPPGVLAALPGIDDQRAASFIKARRTSPQDVDRLVRMLAPAQQYLAVKPQRVASVDVTVALTSGYSTKVSAVIVVVPQDSQPYRVLVWTPAPSIEASIGVTPIAQR